MFNNLTKAFVTIVILLLTGCNLFKVAGPSDSAPSAYSSESWEKNEEYQKSYTRGFDLLHTKLKVAFNWENQELNGTAELSLRPYFYPSDSLVLDAKAMDIKLISLLKSDGTQKKLSFDYDSIKINIKLGKEYTRKDTLKLFIEYVSKPNEVKSLGSHAIREAKGLYFINPHGRNKVKAQQIWTQGETEASSCWFPTIDAPNEKCTQEIYITTQNKYKTLSNGTLVSSTANEDGTRTDYWKQDKKHAPYLFMMAIGEYAVIHDTWEGIPVNYYVEPKDSADARLVFGNTPLMLEFFSEKLGVKYPWSKFSQIVVRDYVSGAMENTSATIYGDFVMRNKRQLIDANYEDIIAHELFHHWFGDLVTCESWSNLTLNESFATYGEYLWKEHYYGRLHAERHLYIDLLKYLNDEPWRPIVNYHFTHKEDMFNRHSYEKGALVIHQLRRYIGDDAFFEGLKLYLTDNQYKTAEIHNLRMAFEEVTGTDLNWYFNQWFMEKGHPILKISHRVQSDSLIVNISQVQLGQGVGLFDLPLTLSIYEGINVRKEKVQVNKENHEFIFIVNEDINWVGIDPDMGFCGEVEEEYSPEQALFVFKNSEHYKDKVLALKSMKGDTSAVAWEVLQAATKDTLEAFRRIGLSFLGKTNEADSDDYKDQLIFASKNDKNSNVRSTAIRMLSKYFEEDSTLIPVYKKALGDSSYRVNGAAIKALHKIKREDALLRAISMEDADDPKTLYILSKLYEDVTDESKITFYMKALDVTEGYYKRAILEYYRKYLSIKSHEFMWKGMKQLKEMAIYDNAKDVRRDAGLAIHELHKVHLKRLEDIRKDIADKKRSSKGKNHDLKVFKEKEQELLEKEAQIQKLINEIIEGETNQTVLDAWENEDFVVAEVIEVKKKEKLTEE
ncbi:MAG: aminopeptidase N [Saprospiraceae bacterium]|jgi:aminopeptidase N